MTHCRIHIFRLFERNWLFFSLTESFRSTHRIAVSTFFSINCLIKYLRMAVYVNILFAIVSSALRKSKFWRFTCNCIEFRIIFVEVIRVRILFLFLLNLPTHIAASIWKLVFANLISAWTWIALFLVLSTAL